MCHPLSRVILAAGILALLAGGASGGWLSGWDCRQEVTVAPSVTPGDLTSFPLLVQIANPGDQLFDTAASAQGHDIAFTRADGVSVLPHEIEYFSKTATKRLDAWAKTDVWSSSPTKLYMYTNSGHLRKREDNPRGHLHLIALRELEWP